MSPGDDQVARLIHSGVGGSPRVMVQHARVVVGAIGYYHGTVIILLNVAAAAVLLAVLCSASSSGA